MPNSQYNTEERFEILKSRVFSVIGTNEAKALSTKYQITEFQGCITNIYKHCCGVIIPPKSIDPQTTIGLISSTMHCHFGIGNNYNYDELKAVVENFIKEELDWLELVLINPNQDCEKLPDPYKILVTDFRQEIAAYTFEYPYPTRVESLKSKLEITDNEALELILLIQINKLKSLSNPDFVDINQFASIARRYEKEDGEITLRAIEEIIEEFAKQEDDIFEEPNKCSIQKVIGKFLQQNPTEEFLNLLYSSYNNVDGTYYQPPQIIRTTSGESLNSHSNDNSTQL